jgi:hypothetical protein
VDIFDNLPGKQMSSYKLPQPMKLHYERPHGLCVLEYYTADQVRQAQLDIVAAGIPAGWQIVPKVATDDMRDAPTVKIGGCYSCSAQLPNWNEAAEIYAEMIAAAPERW